MRPQEYISNRVKIRYDLFMKNPDDKQIDVLADEIVLMINENFYDLEVDFIIETLTKLGYAPNVIYDDNGLFAVSGDGYQPVVCGDEKIDGSVIIYVTPDMWKKTIREALKKYLED